MPTPTPPPTLYRSMLTVHMDHPAIRGALADVHHLHRMIMTGWAHHTETRDFFADANTGHPDHRASLGILFAISKRRPDNTLRIITQAHQPPHWDNAAAHYWETALTDTPRITQRVVETLGTTIAFELRAQPTTTQRTGSRRRKISITDPHHLHTWITRQTERAGLRLTTNPDTSDSLRLESLTKTRRTQHGTGDTANKGFILNTIRFQGVATITDPTTYHDAISNGIGAGKPYGCGLLLTQTR